MNGKQERIFKTLSDTMETQILRPRLEVSGVVIRKLPEILNHESIFQLLSLMLEKPILFRFQIGVLLSFSLR